MQTIIYFALKNQVLCASRSASLRGVGSTSRRTAHRAYKPRVTGSSPVPPTNYIKDLDNFLSPFSFLEH